MLISEFDYQLPEELIAQHPLPERDASRMLLVDRQNRSWQDSHFIELPNCVSNGDVLVINNTRVFPARLHGQREKTGGKVEILLVRELEAGLWEALLRPGHRLRQGAVIAFPNRSITAVVVDERGGEMRVIRFSSAEELQKLLASEGELPLPPYIKRETGLATEDRERYQTVFAHESGAIAAPTAGLHFTPEIINALGERGVQIVEITLHVGYGTFEPIRVENVEEHRVRPELFDITTNTARVINEARTAGKRVIAVGTTTTRALESATSETGVVHSVKGFADLTILPGYEFKVVDALLTNFHLPQSSLLLLVCAFAGRELMLEAYRHAVVQRYRFYSYGDCMLIT